MAGLLLGLQRAGLDMGYADGSSAPRQAPSCTVVSVAPDDAFLRAFGTDLYDSASWNPAYRAGLAQAVTVAGEISIHWSKEYDGTA